MCFGCPGPQYHRTPPLPVNQTGASSGIFAPLEKKKTLSSSDRFPFIKTNRGKSLGKQRGFQ